jgi:hypothetical protein
MGERVVVDPGAAAAAAAEPAPKKVVPLGYGQGGDNWVARAARYWAPFSEAVDELVRRRLGGWRRIGFAFGTSFTSAGFAVALAERNQDATLFMTAVGGLLIGLTVPIRAFDAPQE